MEEEEELLLLSMVDMVAHYRLVVGVVGVIDGMTVSWKREEGGEMVEGRDKGISIFMSIFLLFMEGSGIRVIGD